MSIKTVQIPHASLYVMMINCNLPFLRASELVYMRDLSSELAISKRA
jgi:hypothetical protein